MIRLMTISIMLQMVISVNTSNGQANKDLEDVTGFSHPNSVDVPSDLPFAASTVRTEKGGRQVTTVDFPVIGYQQAHYSGWQKCLALTADQGIEIAKGYIPTGFQTDRKYLLSGTTDGYQNALKIVQSHLDAGVSEAEIQRLCREAHLPSGPPPPSFKSSEESEEPKQQTPKTIPRRMYN